jgi:hypothetical protein
MFERLILPNVFSRNWQPALVNILNILGINPKKHGGRGAAGHQVWIWRVFLYFSLKLLNLFLVKVV